MPGDADSEWVRMSGYNFAWNAEVGTREFWEDSSKGWNHKPGWWGSCSYGYERSSYWPPRAKCQIPSDTKFLTESCNKKSQCVTDFTAKYVDVTCAPSNNDINDPQYKCMLDELADVVSPYASTCSCLGFIWCESSDCAGNQCVLSTMDMEKHCKYQDEDPITLPWSTGSCSNCRASDDSCEAFDGATKYGTDSSRVGIAVGAAGLFSAAGVFTLRKVSAKKREAPSKMVELGAGGTGGTV